MYDLTVCGAGAAKTIAHPPWWKSREADRTYEIRVEHHEICRVARISGVLPIELLLSTLHILGVECDGTGEVSILVDLRDLRGTYTPCDLICIGQEFASSFIHMEQIAVLARSTQSMHVSERVARFTGLNLHVFSTPEDAFGWILGTGGAACRNRSGEAIDG